MGGIDKEKPALPLSGLLQAGFKFFLEILPGLEGRLWPDNEIHEVESGFLLLLCVADGSHYILAANNTIFTAYNGS